MDKSESTTFFNAAINDENGEEQQQHQPNSFLKKLSSRKSASYFS
jgi:hypothetical protein